MRKRKPPDEKTPQGNQPQAGQGDDPKFVTEEQLNRAITSRFKDFEKKLEKSTGDLVTTLTSKLDELVSGKLETLTPKPDDKGEGTKPPVESPELKAMQKKLADMEKQLAQEKSDKEASALRARDKELRSKLTESLSSAGVSGAALKGAIAMLVDGDKRVRFDDDGERLLFRGDDGDELPFADGLKSWLKSEDAKIYLPPRGVAGSGQQPGGAQGARFGEKNNATATAAELLARHLGGGFT